MKILYILFWQRFSIKEVLNDWALNICRISIPTYFKIITIHTFRSWNNIWIHRCLKFISFGYNNITTLDVVSYRIRPDFCTTTRISIACWTSSSSTDQSFPDTKISRNCKEYQRNRGSDNQKDTHDRCKLKIRL